MLCSHILPDKASGAADCYNRWVSDDGCRKGWPRVLGRKRLEHFACSFPVYCAPSLVEESTPAGCELRAEATASEIAPPPPRGRLLSARSRRPAATASSTVSASRGSSTSSSSGLKFVFPLAQIQRVSQSANYILSPSRGSSDSSSSGLKFVFPLAQK